jgi:hypothetical protein
MISPPIALWESSGSPDILEYLEIKLLAREGSVHQFVGLEPALGVSRQSIKKKIQCWLDKQHMTLWQDLTSTKDRLEN